MVNVAFETQMSPAQIIYIPNVSEVYDLKDMIENSEVFEDEGKNDVYLISACLMWFHVDMMARLPKLPLPVITWNYSNSRALLPSAPNFWRGYPFQEGRLR